MSEPGLKISGSSIQIRRFSGVFGAAPERQRLPAHEMGEVGPEDAGADRAVRPRGS